jgi:hypothetical protein
MHDLEWYDDDWVMNSKQFEKKTSTAYREVITSNLSRGIKENKENLS